MAASAPRESRRGVHGCSKHHRAAILHGRTLRSHSLLHSNSCTRLPAEGTSSPGTCATARSSGISRSCLGRTCPVVRPDPRHPSLACHPSTREPLHQALSLVSGAIRSRPEYRRTDRQLFFAELAVEAAYG